MLIPGDQIMSCIKVETEGVMEGHWNPAPFCAGQAGSAWKKGHLF